MERDIDILKYLPLTETTYYTMLALQTPLHGYAVMQKVDEISQGTVKLGAGTLYGAFVQLEKEHLIEKVSEEERRKNYQLTDAGRRLLRSQVDRLKIMVKAGENLL